MGAYGLNIMGWLSKVKKEKEPIETSLHNNPISAKNNSCSHKTKIYNKMIDITSNNQRLGSAFYDLDPRLPLLCQVGGDVIRPCKICGGGGGGVPDMRRRRSIHLLIDCP